MSYSWSQTSQTEGQQYSDTSPFSIPWLLPMYIKNIQEAAYLYKNDSSGVKFTTPPSVPPTKKLNKPEELTHVCDFFKVLKTLILL